MSLAKNEAVYGFGVIVENIQKAVKFLVFYLTRCAETLLFWIGVTNQFETLGKLIKSIILC